MRARYVTIYTDLTYFICKHEYNSIESYMINLNVLGQ